MMGKWGRLVIAVCWSCVMGVAVGEEWLSGVDTWGGRKAEPAVVNPVVRGAMQEVISLRGEWEFITKGVAPLRQPRWYGFYAQAWPGSRSIEVPGCWEVQGVGEPGPSETWDCKWDHGPREMRNVYMGEAWYRKRVEIPAEWAGKRVWLKIGGVRSQGWFWVNNKTVALVDNYCGTYKYDITDLVEPGGEAVVVAAVNNSTPSRKGQMVSSHKFGGLYRDVEIEATPDMRLDDAWVRGDFDGGAAEVHATVAFSTEAGRLAEPVLRVRIVTADGVQAGVEHEAPVRFDAGARAAEVVLRVPLNPFLPWSPESPNLYVAHLTLCDGDQPIHDWAERFGVRKVEVRGDRFFLNDKPLFIRGFGDDYVYPLTISSPVSLEEHREHLMIARAAGFNYVRLHTHCELPEYFEAADEVGIMIQPELPYYGDYPTEAFTFDPMRDLRELYAHYRRYVSFTTYCTGNEGLLGKPLDREIYKLAKRLDPDRLMLHQDGELNTAENSDFRNGPINVWAPGSFECDAPFVAHEYLNLSVKQDPRNEDRFTGGWMPPVTLAERDERLAAAGLDRRWGDACQDAAHALQSVYQKRGLEAARLDPACDGYDYWTIVDVVVQQGGTYSAQGLFDPFWGVKRNGSTPEFFRRFNGPSALLLTTSPESRIAVSGEVVETEIWISHYGEAAIAEGEVQWRLRAGDRVLSQGGFPSGAVELGSTRLLTEFGMTIPVVERPVHAELDVVLTGTDPTGDGVVEVQNSWDFWLFPTRARQRLTGVAVSESVMPSLEPLYEGLIPAGTEAADAAELLISRMGSPDVGPALAAGKRVLMINGTEGAPNVSLGWWAMGNQVGTAFAEHPTLGDFPHDGVLSPLAFRILKQGLRLPFEGMRADEMMVVGEGLNDYYLYAGEARVGAGRVLMTFGLDLLSGLPEGTCLLDGLIRYARSDAFAPEGELPLIGREQNGWAATLAAGDVGFDHLPFGATQLDVARAMAGMNVLEWETRPMPADVGSQSTVSVVWQGGMGYFAEPQGSFRLYLHDAPLLEIAEISQEDAQWVSPDGSVSLVYERDLATQEFGTMTLTLPTSAVEPGAPLRLKVVGSESGSRRWFGVFRMW